MKRILLFGLVSMLTLCFSGAWAQSTRSVSGRVTAAEDGSGLPGVNVLVKGTTNGTVTDADGRYTISVSAAKAVLMVSFIGYQSQEVEVGERTVVDISMASDITQLQEVVVTALGVEKEAKSLGVSVASVKSSELTQARGTNFATGLAAKVSGLQINQVNNGLNPTPRIVLRGNRSFLGNNQALLVVDGVQTSTDFYQTINPNDIENVSVLKGANAAALYGADAANGVLVVTTKTGSPKKTQISVNSVTEIERVAFLPKLQNRFGAAGGEGPGDDVFTLDPNFPLPYVAYENQSYGPEFDGSTQQLGRWVYDANGNKIYQYHEYSPNLDAKKDFWNVGVNRQNDVSLSTGTDHSTFYISLQDVQKQSSMPGDKMKRDIFRFNGDTKYGIFKASYKISYTSQKLDQTSNAGGIYNAVFNVPNSIDLTKFKDWRNDPFSTPEGYFNDFSDNPYWLIDRDRFVNNKNSFIGNLQLSVKPLKWLELTSRTALTINNQRVQYNGLGTQFNPVRNPDRYASNRGNVRPSSTRDFIDERNIISDLIATAKHKVGDVDITLLGGLNVQARDYNSSSIGSSNLIRPDVLNPDFRYGNLSGNFFTQQRRRWSYYFDLSLGYKDFLFLHTSYRKDWTSVLAKGNNSFGYAGVDASFVFTEGIPALKDIGFLTAGKIFASYAKTGNVNISPYQLVPTYGNGGYQPFVRGTSDVFALFQSSQIVSPSILPEFTLSKEIGLDLDFWNDRAGIKTAVYQTNTTNQTVPISISNSTGYTSALVNSGEMLVRGLEMDGRVTPIYTPSGFKVELKANYTYLITNTPLSIYQPATGDGITQLSLGNNVFAQVGQQYPNLRLNDWVRSPDGQVVVDAITGLPKRDPNLTNFGSTNPRHRLGLVLNLSYKAWSFSAVGDYRAGGLIYNAIGNNIEFGGVGHLSAQAGRQRFVYPNSVIQNADGSYTPNTNITINDGNYNFWQGLYNTVPGNYVVKSDFWKLREIIVTYAVPAAVLAKTKVIKTAKVSLYGRNLLMFRPKSNQWTDPEFSVDNGNALGTTTVNQTPPTRLYGVNIALTF